MHDHVLISSQMDVHHYSPKLEIGHHVISF